MPTDPLEKPELAAQLYSPQWWRDRLDKAMRDRSSELIRYDGYYDGAHRQAFTTPKFREAFGSLFDRFADNWCALVPDAVEERLDVEGFLLEPDAPDSDDDAWRIWQENNLDGESQIGHLEALIKSEAAVIVWPSANPKVPLITVEDPRQVIVAQDPANRRNRQAALKKWVDDDEHIRTTLYRADGVFKWRSDKQLRGYTAEDGTWATIQWAPFRENESDPWPIPNPYQVVPVVPLYNRPRLLRAGTSEIRQVIPIQDAVNKLCVDMLVASEFAAFRQRYAVGLELPRDPDTNEVVDPFSFAIDRLWTVERDEDGEVPQVKFGEFSATDLSNYVKAVETLVQHIASQSRTPPHYFYLGGQFPSGESIKSAEAGLVAKTLRKQRFLGESWEDVIRLAFLIAGETEKANAKQAATIWRDAETRTEGEHIDSVLKRQALGIPNEMLWEDAGYSQQQIARIKALKAQEALELAATTIPPRPAPEVVPAPAPAANGDQPQAGELARAG